MYVHVSIFFNILFHYWINLHQLLICHDDFVISRGKKLSLYMIIEV